MSSASATTPARLRLFAAAGALTLAATATPAPGPLTGARGALGQAFVGQGLRHGRGDSGGLGGAARVLGWPAPWLPHPTCVAGGA